MPTKQLPLERIGRITGSRIAGVLELSPYQTRSEVMREMVREYFWAEAEFQGNFITEYGTRHEPDGIAEYELTRQTHVENHGDDQLTIVHDTHPLAVTPDGWVSLDDDALVDGLVEVKCPWRGLYTKHDERPDYQSQMALQEFVTQREWCDFVVWRHEGTSVSRHHYDEKWWPSVQSQVEDFIAEFQSYIDDEDRAQPFLEPIVDRRTDEAWAQAEATYWDALHEQERAMAQLAAAKAELSDLAGAQSTKGSRIHLVWTPPKSGGFVPGNVSYKAVAEDLAARLELDEAAKKKLYDEHRGKGSNSRGVQGSFSFRRIEEAS